jgi:predicted Zn-dependent protease with MMP-like domain
VKGGLSPGERDRFDALVERVIAELPEGIGRLIDEMPVVVEDVPDAALLRDLGMNPDEADELCGLHTGVANTESSVESPGDLPSQIMLFRVGILAMAGGWEAGVEGGTEASVDAGEESVLAEIRVTLLHEIGHQFGLDEDDLRELGYE